jgi:hypothetical protein
MVISTLLLDWTEKSGNYPSRHHSFVINSIQMVKIGRDPTQCDLVIAHPTVSRLHAVIFFCEDPTQLNSLPVGKLSAGNTPVSAALRRRSFYLRNLNHQHNYPVVDGQKVVAVDAPLHLHSTINLGVVKLEVSQIDLAPARARYGFVCPNPACQSVVGDTYSIPICNKCGHSLTGAMRVLISS